MEVILVDDGSPDNCPKMCDEWAKKDNRIIVIHKKNGGLSDARNAALDIAKGNFVTFVDSDDWLSDNTLVPLIDSFIDCDIMEYSIEGRLQLQDRVYENIDDYWIKEGHIPTHMAAIKFIEKSCFMTQNSPKAKFSRMPTYFLYYFANAIKSVPAVMDFTIILITHMELQQEQMARIWHNY
jgi:glycosyltransferase involved in cell wall biosynthesis